MPECSCADLGSCEDSTAQLQKELRKWTLAEKAAAVKARGDYSTVVRCGSCTMDVAHEMERSAGVKVTYVDHLTGAISGAGNAFSHKGVTLG